MASQRSIDCEQTPAVKAMGMVLDFDRSAGPAADLAFRTYRHDLRNILGAACLKLEQLEASTDPAVADMARSIQGLLRKACTKTDGQGLGEPLAVYASDALTSSLSDVVMLLGLDPDVARPEMAPEVDGLCIRRPDLLTRILFNLIQNVQIHGKPDTRVTVSVSANTRWLQIRVRDTGPGVPAPVADRLFTPYNKGRQSGGAGLGLYSAYSMATDLGGSVRLEETGPDGSCFLVELRAERGLIHDVSLPSSAPIEGDAPGDADTAD